MKHTSYAGCYDRLSHKQLWIMNNSFPLVATLLARSGCQILQNSVVPFQSLAPTPSLPLPFPISKRWWSTLTRVGQSVNGRPRIADSIAANIGIVWSGLCKILCNGYICTLEKKKKKKEKEKKVQVSGLLAREIGLGSESEEGEKVTQDGEDGKGMTRCQCQQCQVWQDTGLVTRQQE